MIFILSQHIITTTMKEKIINILHSLPFPKSKHKEKAEKNEVEERVKSKEGEGRSDEEKIRERLRILGYLD